MRDMRYVPDMGAGDAARRWFIGLWFALLAFKLVLASQLPLFVDEAFYWQEGMHPGWAYSDLPALTAWLARLGVTFGGQHALALRAPFLLLAAWAPWLVASIARRARRASCVPRRIAFRKRCSRTPAPSRRQC